MLSFMMIPQGTRHNPGLGILTSLDDGSDLWNLVVGRDRDVADGHYFVPVKQHQRYAPLPVHLGDDEGGGFLELEL